VRYSLADEALEDARYDSQSLRTFVGIDLGCESVADATTLLKFRRLLEDQGLTEDIFAAINAILRERALMLNKGTMADASIFAAPSSTKNKAKARDPDMHQTRKGNQWYFGRKAHIGADVDSGRVHSLRCTAANVADIVETEHLRHGQEPEVFADAGYTGADKRAELAGQPVRWQIAMKRGKLKAMAAGALKDLTGQAEHLKAKIRARVEHPFHVVKNLFRHRKVRSKGLEKNPAPMHTLFALANLVIAKKALLA
jgi:IS5 family transposase